MTAESKLQTRNPNEHPEKMPQRAAVAPLCDIFENKDEVLIVADLPGVTKEDLAVHVDKGQLTLEGRMREFGPDEQPYDYRRTFVVPQGIDTERIAANLQGGVLRVSLPKPASMKPKQITVKAG